jgi:hypothetical protein
MSNEQWVEFPHSSFLIIFFIRARSEGGLPHLGGEAFGNVQFQRVARLLKHIESLFMGVFFYRLVYDGPRHAAYEFVAVIGRTSVAPYPFQPFQMAVNIFRL